MGFTIPNYTDAVTNKAVGDQAEPDSVDFQILGNSSNGLVYDTANYPNNGLVSPEGTISNNVTVEKYKVFINGGYFVKSTSTTLTLTGGASNPRFDLIVIRASNPTEPTYITGTTDAANPVFPSILDGDVVLAAIYRNGTCSSGFIANTHIVDKRTFVNSNQTWVGSSPLTDTAANNAKIGDLWLDSTAVSTGQSMLWVKQTNGWVNLSRFITPASTNTAQTLVYRDSQGNFSAGTVTASLSGNASSATLSAKSSTLSQGGGNGTAMTFNWSGQGGQPTWLWGSNDGTNHYVWNPGNFSVNYANSAGSAGSASSATVASNVTGIADHIVAQKGFEVFTGDYAGETLTVKRGINQSSSYATQAWRNSSGTVMSYINSTGGGVGLSDRNYKDKIVDADYQHLVNGIDNLKVRNFVFKENPSETHVGLIAQEVQKHLPEVVSSLEGALGINTDGLIYALIAKVQQLETRVLELESR